MTTSGRPSPPNAATDDAAQEAPYWDGDVLPIGPGRLVISAATARLLAGALTAYSRTEGVPLTPRLRNIQTALLRGGETNTGTPEPASAIAGKRSDHDLITTTEAAQLLGVSREYVNRLARTGTFGESPKINSRRYIHRTAIELHRRTA